MMSNIGSILTTTSPPRPWELQISRPAEGTLILRLAGSWRLEDGLPGLSEGEGRLEAGPPVRRLSFEAESITAWDSGLLSFVRKLMDEGQRRGILVDRGGLPEGAQGPLTPGRGRPHTRAGRGGEG